MANQKTIVTQKAWVKIIQLFGFSFLFYFLINVVLLYLILFKVYLDAVSAKKPTEGLLAFKLEYLYLPYGDIPVFPAIGISFVIAMFLVKRLDEGYKVKNANKELKGNDHFMTAKELQKDTTLYHFDTKDMHSAEKSGLPIALIKDELYVSPDTVHSLIIGTTRSGKGQTFVLPSIRQIAMSQAKHSLVCNDPKGELLENTYDILIKEGYKILVLNLRDTKLSSLWNPLQIIIDEYVKAMKDDKDLSKTIKLVQSLASVFTDNPKSDPIWPDSARSLLVSIILLLLDKGYTNGHLDKVNMYSVNNFLIEYGTMDKTVVENRVPKTINALDEIFKALPIGHPAKSAYSTSNFAKGEMRSSIFSTLASNINIFATDMGISKLTSGNQIFFEDLIEPTKPCACFMIVPDEDTSRHVIASLFVNQCYNHLVELSSQYPNQKLPQRVHFQLDEFGNMVRIPAMDTKITVGAGRNLLFDLYVQDLNQLDTKYDNAAKTIRSNCGNLVYINSLDKDTNEYMAAVIGNETAIYETYSGELSTFVKNRNINVDSKPLMTATQLSKMQFGETVVKRQRSEPIKTKFEPFYKLGIEPTSITKIPMQLINVDLNDKMYPIKDFIKEINWNEDKSPAQPAAAQPAVRPQIPKTQPPNSEVNGTKSAAPPDRMAERAERFEMEKKDRHTPRPDFSHTRLEKAPSAPPSPSVSSSSSPFPDPTVTENIQLAKPEQISATDRFDEIKHKLDEYTNGEFSEAYGASAYEVCNLFAQKYRNLGKITKEEEEIVISHIAMVDI